jgi:hypothetical protein
MAKEILGFGIFIDEDHLDEASVEIDEDVDFDDLRGPFYSNRFYREVDEDNRPDYSFHNLITFLREGEDDLDEDFLARLVSLAEHEGEGDLDEDEYDLFFDEDEDEDE